MKNTKKLNSLKITGLRASTARQNTRRKARVWKDWGAIFWQNWSSGASEKNLYIYDKCSYWLASLPALHITSWEDVVPVNTDGAISESPMCVCVCVCVSSESVRYCMYVRTACAWICVSGGSQCPSYGSEKGVTPCKWLVFDALYSAVFFNEEKILCALILWEPRCN